MVRAGSKKWNSGGQLVEVEKTIIHPKYDQDTYDYDVAVLQVSRRRKC